MNVHIVSAGQPLTLDDFFARLPKAELHCHLLGAIRHQTFLELARREGGMTPEAVDGLYAQGEKRQGAIPGLRALEAHILKRPDDLYRITREYLHDARQHNVLYTEFFWNPTGTVLGSGLSYKTLQDAIVRAIHDALADDGIIGRLIPAIDREAGLPAALEMVEWITAHRCDEVQGIGMDYREAYGPPEEFAQAYAAAKRAGLKATAHAGEFGLPWTNVKTAIDLLGVDRVDHGYTVIDEPELAQRCVDSGLIFTVVPANSYYLRTLAPERWALDHPIRAMHKLGLRMHPNSDDPTLHNISPTKVWTMMVEDFGLSVDDLRDMMLNGLDGAWIDDSVRRRWRTEWTAAFDALRARLAPVPTDSAH